MRRHSSTQGGASPGCPQRAYGQWATPSHYAGGCDDGSLASSSSCSSASSLKAPLRTSCCYLPRPAAALTPSLYYVRDADDLKNVRQLEEFAVVLSEEGKWTDFLLPIQQRQLFKQVAGDHFV